MKRKIINILSIFVILVSLASWKFLLPKIINKDKPSSQESSVRVEGEKKENQQPEKQAPAAEAKPQDPASAPLNMDLFEHQPDAPLKKEKTGDVYMRARSAIAIDADTGTILHYQDGKKKTAIASLTKMMTAVLVVENIKNLEDEIISVDKESLYVEGTVVGCPRSGYCVSNRLRVGEKISALNLLRAMLMNSCNDAAFILGKHIAGSKEEFAKMMNRKAEELGLSDTHFCNPSGLDEDDKPGQCYSSAYDLARIAAYSLRHKEIWDIMKTPTMDVYSADGKTVHNIINTDVLLDQMPNCLGGKTGFTYEAGKSLMMAAHDPNNTKHQVVAVVIDDEYRWEDMKILFGWVFNAYQWPKK